MKTIPLFVLAAWLCASATAAETWRVSSRGYGPVRIGMTLSQVENLMGTKLRTEQDKPLEPLCDLVYPAKGHQGISFMVQEGRITHVSVSTRRVLTKSGIGIGTPAAKLKKLFGSQLDIDAHKYDDEGYYYIAWEADRKHGVKFEIGSEEVIAITAGDETIMLVEGCS